jgi:hypothetical protein
MAIDRRRKAHAYGSPHCHHFSPLQRLGILAIDRKATEMLAGRKYYKYAQAGKL